MKKMNMIKKMMFLLIPAMLGCSLAMAQSDGKKSKPTASTDLKAKYEANGLQYDENAVKQMPEAKNNGARACVKSKNTQVVPNKVSKKLFDKLPAERQAYVKNHPEKFILVD